MIQFDLTPTKTTPGSFAAGEYNSLITALTSTIGAYPMANIPTPAALGLYPNKSAGQKMASSEYNNIVTLLGQAIAAANSANGGSTAPSVLIAATSTAQGPRLSGTAAAAAGVQSIFIKVYDSLNQLAATFGPSAPGDTAYVTTWAAGSAGNYTAKAIATDRNGLSATSEAVSFSISAQTTPVNIAPTANAGANASLQLPVNSITLNGSGADSDGTIARYAFRQISGPSSVSGMPASVVNPTLTGLIAGTYQFGLTTTDDKGATSTESVTTVTVMPANNPALAGDFAVIDGNSIDANQGGDFSGQLGTQFQQFITQLGFNDTYTFTSVAVPGQNTASTLSDVSVQVVPLFDSSKKKNLFYNGEPFNGLRGGATAEEEFARVKTYFETIKAANPSALCIGTTPTPDLSRDPSAPINPNFEGQRQRFATLMRNAWAARVPWLDALADYAADTCIDPSNPALSGDGIHYTQAGAALRARRAAYAFREAAYGIAQPAPILKTADNYASNAAVFTFQRPTGNHIVSTAGILTVDGGGLANYGNLGTDTYFLAAGKAGRVIFKFVDANDRDAVIAVSTSNAPASYGNYQAGAYVGGGTSLTIIDNGGQVQTGETPVGGTFYAIRRVANGTITLEKSTDLVNWVFVKTYSFSSTAILYVRIDMFGSGRISYPQGEGFELLAGSSDGGDVGPYNGVNTFGDNVYLTASGENLVGITNPQTGNWGGLGVNTAHYLAANTAGRLILKINDALADVILGMSLSSGKGGYPTIEYSMYIPTTRSLKANLAGQIVNIINSIANLQKISIYRNANTGLVTLEILPAGATRWESVYEFPALTKQALYFRVDLNQDGVLPPSEIEGGTAR